jgi:hypothetical protein
MGHAALFPSLPKSAGKNIRSSGRSKQGQVKRPSRKYGPWPTSLKLLSIAG